MKTKEIQVASDSDVLEAVTDFPKLFTYVYRNILAGKGFTVTTVQVRRALKRLERSGKVIDVTGSYKGNLRWMINPKSMQR